MSRYIKTAGETSSQIGQTQVDLSKCEIRTDCNITTTCPVTASNFCGSGKTLCDNRWDLICCFSSVSSGCTSGCIGYCIMIDLPTSSYDRFEFSMEGLCFICSYGLVGFSNFNCLCTGSSVGFCACCLNVDASSSLGFLLTGLSYQCIFVYGCSGAISPGYASFDLSITKTIPDNGIDFYYCNYICTSSNYQYTQCKGTICGDGTIGLAWNGACCCTCRFTSIRIYTTGYQMCYSPLFNWSLYGRKINQTTYSNAG